MWVWNNRKISYVGVLIAASVVFVLIGSMMFAITTFPSIKISFAGVTVKITGFMFGPFIGAITGFLADLISFLYLPTYYHIGYSLSLSITGFIPGVVMWIFSRKKYSVNTHFMATISVLTVIMVALFVGIWFLPDSAIAENNLFVHSRLLYELIVLFGFAVLFILTIVFRFKFTEHNFRGVSQIIIFTAILGIINPLLIPLWDQSSIGLDYVVGLALRTILTAPEMILNIVIIFIAWKIIAPQITKNFSNAYD